jgi:hypothetical protein
MTDRLPPPRPIKITREEARDEKQSARRKQRQDDHRMTRDINEGRYQDE